MLAMVPAFVEGEVGADEEGSMAEDDDDVGAARISGIYLQEDVIRTRVRVCTLLEEALNHRIIPFHRARATRDD